jgi:putative transposase
MSPNERNAMINRDHTDLSLTSQCKLLKISRSSLYYVPVGVNTEALKLMNEIDRVFTKYPFFPSRALLRNTLPGSGQPPDRGLLAEKWFSCRSSPCAQVDGTPGNLQRPKHQQEASTAPDLPIPASEATNHAAERGILRPAIAHTTKLGAYERNLLLNGNKFGSSFVTIVSGNHGH